MDKIILIDINIKEGDANTKVSRPTYNFNEIVFNVMLFGTCFNESAYKANQLFDYCY